jgi:NAD(P)-dependent dehydrogenase (short-subunit alcohol dehydrogenase family)
METGGMNHADINFYFDPLCPFAWMTSKWVRQVAARRDYTVDWRFISLRMINAGVDYDSRFPAGYAAGHTAGLRLLRVAARTNTEHGRQSVGPLYEAIGTQAFDSAAAPALGPEERGSREFVEPLLERAGLPPGSPALSTTPAGTVNCRAETYEALTLTGKDVGTPIIHFGPPIGTAFFGPAISRLPSGADAVRLWDHVGLASFPGASKAALVLLTKAWAAEFGPSGVRVNAVNPGPTRTEGTAVLGEAIDEFAALAPAGRPASPDEIAAAITYLASDNASFVHGAILAVDGGRTAA